MRGRGDGVVSDMMLSVADMCSAFSLASGLVVICCCDTDSVSCCFHGDSVHIRDMQDAIPSSCRRVAEI